MDPTETVVEATHQRAVSKWRTGIIRVLLYAFVVQLAYRGIFTIPFPSVSPGLVFFLRYVFLAFTIIDMIGVKIMGTRMAAHYIAAHSLSDRDLALPVSVHRLYLITRFQLWIAELTVFYGFIIYYLSAGKLVYFYTFWLLSLAIFGIHYPRHDTWSTSSNC